MLRINCRSQLAHFRHICRNIYVYLNGNKELLEVPIEICTNPLGFSFGKQGWHYLIETLKQYDACAGLKLRDSVLFQYHQHYQPISMFDLVSHKSNLIKFRSAIFVFPWGDFTVVGQERGAAPKNQFASRFCGPSSVDLIEADFHNLINLYNDIKERGYRPWSKRGGFIGGTLLVRNDGIARYVVLQGNHRMAILSHLGIDQVLTRYIRGNLRLVSEDNVNDWYYVKIGACSIQDALAYFNVFFEINGTERAIK